MAAFDIRNFTLTRCPVPRSQFAKAVEKALPGWDISLVFAGEQRALSLNKSLRNKDYIPNILSYEVGKRSGEIILCPSVSAREASEYGHTKNEHLLYLFIHGLLHLKGLQHSVTMEARERSLLRACTSLPSKPNGTTNRNRH